MELREMKVRITLLEQMLGTASNDPEIHKTYIASKAPDAPSIEEEIASVGVDEVVEQGKTVFPKDENGRPFLWDYQIRGFFKDACGMLRKVSASESSKVKAYKKEIDGLIFVEPRRIPLVFDGEIGECQRPLRAQTAQGERVALANSETVPAGTTLEFTVQMLTNDDKLVKEWLEYGKLRGLGQWRNSGMGRFTYEIIK